MSASSPPPPTPPGPGAGRLLREDLVPHCLNVVKIQLPLLRERKEDIPLLIDHFIKKYSAQQGKDIVGISSGALFDPDAPRRLPGNEELENIIEYAFILCEGGYIQPRHLPDPRLGLRGTDNRGRPCSWATDLGGDRTAIHSPQIGAQTTGARWPPAANWAFSKDTLRRKIERYGLENPLGNGAK